MALMKIKTYFSGLCQYFSTKKSWHIGALMTRLMPDHWKETITLTCQSSNASHLRCKTQQCGFHNVNYYS